MKTEPNWNEAPDGATLFWTNPFSYSPWFKIEKGMLYNFDNLDRAWCCMEDIKHRFDQDSFIKRPTVNHQLTVPVVNQELTTEEAGCSKMKPTTWDGEGLPPIGTVCEVFVKGYWRECKIENHLKTYKDSNLSTDVIFSYKLDSGRPEWCWHDGSRVSKFRPIKSDRERWVEAVCEAMEKQTSLIVSDFQLGIIYDAGLAKLPE